MPLGAKFTLFHFALAVTFRDNPIMLEKQFHPMWVWYKGSTYCSPRLGKLAWELSRCCSRTVSVLVGLVMTSATPYGLAQQLTTIYPRHAVAQTETRFTVEGVALPTVDSAQEGLKLSTVPAGSCQNARRYKAATADRYYFSCTFDSASTPVLVRIHNKTGNRSEFLGSFPISVLDGPPVLANLTISGNIASSNARVRCEIGAACATLVGDLTASDILSIEAKGINLPPELYFEVEGCLQVRPGSPGQGKDTREASCTVAAGDGSRRIRVLTAAPTRGGQELWKIDLNAAAP